MSAMRAGPAPLRPASATSRTCSPSPSAASSSQPSARRSASGSHAPGVGRRRTAGAAARRRAAADRSRRARGAVGGVELGHAGGVAAAAAVGMPALGLPPVGGGQLGLADAGVDAQHGERVHGRRLWRTHRAATNSDCVARPSGPSLVVQDRGGQRGALRAVLGHRLQRGPLAGRDAREADGQVGVDEQVALEAQLGGDAVAEVGGRDRALGRARLLAGDQRQTEPEPCGRRARAAEDAGGEAQLHGREREAPAPGRAARPGSRRPRSVSGAGSRAAGIAASGTATASRRRRTARARQTTRSPAVTVASTSCRRRPGRTTSAATVSGASGTAARNSTVSRASSIGPGASSASTARASSAAGAPPCSASGSHGPRAWPVGTNASPSGNEDRGGLGRAHVRAARSAMTRESWPPCQASGDLPGSSLTSSAPGIAAA